jgi:hypothetical protein
MKAIRFGVVAIFASASIMGCAAESAPVDGDLSEQVGESESAIVRAPLLGKWEGEGGTIQKLELTSKRASSIGGGIVGNRFNATIDTGIRCITTPCPSQMEVSGIYTTTATKITLTAFDKPAREFAAILGTYKYTVTTDALHIWNATRDESFHKAAPHCADFESIDDQGNPLNKLTAENVSSYWAGKQLFNNITNFTNEHLSAGVCDAPQICTKEYFPVCGSINGGAPKTFGNRCTFRAEVKHVAGRTSSAEGTWDQGACCASDSDCSFGFCGVGEHGNNVCKPFSQVGERCGGFTLPSFQKRCEPGLTCVYSEATHDVPGTCQAIK